MNKLILVRLDSNYCNYLRLFDNKVPYNYKEKELRPFVGALLQVNNFMYFAPLSSPKPKHLKLRAKLDFLKIDNGKLGAINFNNMIPVTTKNIIPIDLDKKSLNIADEKYRKLLKEQLLWLNRNKVKLYNRAKKLYYKYTSGTLNYKMANRCCNFKLLEEKCLEYSTNKFDKKNIFIYN